MIYHEPFDEPSTKARDLELGEHYAQLAKEYGAIAAKFLFRGQWVYEEPEWFDHRLHLLDPEKHFNDFWTMSADNVIRVLPFNGTLLDLCSGDGFYDYHFYRHRADVVAIENNPEAYDLAVKHHSHPRIEYVFKSIFDYALPESFFDVVLIRGAIEHFSLQTQYRIFDMAHHALKPGGYFCGDTPAKRPEQDKMLAAHECEWKDEKEMRAALGYYPWVEVKTWTLVSTERTTLFWRCRK